MVCWARSWLSQKFGWPIRSVRRSRSLILLAMSKRVSELGQTGQHVVGTATEVRVHGVLPIENGLPCVVLRPATGAGCINSNAAGQKRQRTCGVPGQEIRTPGIYLATALRPFYRFG